MLNNYTVNEFNKYSVYNYFDYRLESKKYFDNKTIYYDYLYAIRLGLGEDDRDKKIQINRNIFIIVDYYDNLKGITIKPDIFNN